MNKQKKLTIFFALSLSISSHLTGMLPKQADHSWADTVFETHAAHEDQSVSAGEPELELSLPLIPAEEFYHYEPETQPDIFAFESSSSAESTSPEPEPQDSALVLHEALSLPKQQTVSPDAVAQKQGIKRKRSPSLKSVQGPSKRPKPDTHRAGRPFHERTFKCTHTRCKQTFKDEQELKKHIQSHLETRVKCTFPGCQESFTKTAELKTHRETHQPKKEYFCTQEDCICKGTKAYVTLERLKQHIRDSKARQRRFEKQARKQAEETRTQERRRQHQQQAAPASIAVPAYTPEQWASMQQYDPAQYEAWQRFYYPEFYMQPISPAAGPGAGSAFTHTP